MASNLKALDRELQDKGPRPIYLVQGEERLLVDECVRLILRHAIGDPDDAMAVTRVDLAESGKGARDVVAACQSMGLFASKVAVVVRAADVVDKKTTERDELARYASAPNAAATLILVAGKLNGSSALVKRIKKNGAVLTFQSLRSRDVPGWVAEEARGLGHRVDPSTARLIGELVGTSLQQLRLAVDQLSLFVGPGAPITEQAVETVLSATRAHSVFELVDAVGEKRMASALGHLDAMLDHREQPLRILAMLMRHFRMLWQVGAARERGIGRDDIIGQLRLHPYQGKKMWAQATRFSRPQLKLAWERLYEADLHLKSAGLDDETVMERLVMELCA